MEEGVPAEHGRELHSGELEQLRYGRALANESDHNLEATDWDVADSCLDIAGD